jgi:hypothetical protein
MEEGCYDDKRNIGLMFLLLKIWICRIEEHQGYRLSDEAILVE